MLRTLSITYLFVLIALTVTAQPDDTPGRNPEERAKFSTERMTTDLALTPEQGEKVYSVQLAFFTSMEQYRGQDRRTMFRGLQDANKKRNADLKSILTPEQYAAHQKKEEERKAKMRERMQERRNGGGGTPPPPPADGYK